MIKSSDSAVSPVVGVMLMLVVTIIIAAVVSAFAGGLSGNTQTAPQAAIDVRISSTGGGSMTGTESNAEFELLSGDSIPTKDIAIITYYTNDSGHTYKHEQTATSTGTSLYGVMDYSSYGVSGGFDYSNYTSVNMIARVPFLNDMRNGYAGGGATVSGGSELTPNLKPDFGNFTWMPGDIMSTNGDAGTADLLGINGTAEPHQIIDPDFGIGSLVEIKILHIPSEKYIFDKEVIVR